MCENSFRFFTSSLRWQIFKPSASAMIRFLEHRENGSFAEVLSIDTSNSPDVKVQEHPMHAGLFRLSFVNSRHLRVGARYSILLDPGVVVGALSCTGGGSPFPGLSDRTIWQFTTNSAGRLSIYASLGEANGSADLVKLKDPIIVIMLVEHQFCILILLPNPIFPTNCFWF